MDDKKKALIAMSGGVDSAVAALLLNSSYSLTGITMRLWENNSPVLNDSSTETDVNSLEAKKIADLLGFAHITVAMGEPFYNNVVKRFIDDYRQGKTPNPCVECNKHIKFGKLFDIADELKIKYLATGHYAIIKKDTNGNFELRKAKDQSKDQSYFLWSIKKERLSHILFPLGEYSKSEIRELAAQNNFSNAHRADSQDICFIPDGNYMNFLKDHINYIPQKGNFVDISGNILGEHQGIESYTIGQRKGLGIALGQPMFVCKKDPCLNTVTLCDNKDLYSLSLTASSINMLIDESFELPVKLEAKIRYRHAPAKATVQKIDDKRINVIFSEPQRAITPGQSLVLYDGDTVIGGGIIDS